MFCCFYISCSVTAQQSLPKVVRLTVQCVYVHETVSVFMYERAGVGVDKRACSKCLLHSLSKTSIVRIRVCVCVCVCPCLPCSSRQKWCACCVFVHLCTCLCAPLTEGAAWLVMEAEACCYRDAGIQWKTLLNKKQVGCMMQNHPDGMSYAWVSVMLGGMFDGRPAWAKFSPVYTSLKRVSRGKPWQP